MMLVASQSQLLQKQLDLELAAAVAVDAGRASSPETHTFGRSCSCAGVVAVVVVPPNWPAVPGARLVPDSAFVDLGRDFVEVAATVGPGAVAFVAA